MEGCLFIYFWQGGVNGSEKLTVKKAMDNQPVTDPPHCSQSGKIGKFFNIVNTNIRRGNGKQGECPENDGKLLFPGSYAWPARLRLC